MEHLPETGIKVQVMGVGGAGVNILNFLNAEKWAGVSLVAMNTDVQSLGSSEVDHKVLLGHAMNRGLSAGGSRELGAKIGTSELPVLQELLFGIDVLFIVTGLGGGTGSGVAPIIAREARKQGALVFCFACLPFTLEGSARYEVAEAALNELRMEAGVVIPLPNDLLLQEFDKKSTVMDAFRKGSEWVSRGIQSVLAIIQKTGMINVDLATLRALFMDSTGKTLYSLGKGEGTNFMQKAIDDVMICPLLFIPQQMRQADNLLINIIGGKSLSLADINLALASLSEKFSSKQQTVIGALIDDSKTDYAEICVMGKAAAGRSLRRGAFNRQESQLKESHAEHQSLLFAQSDAVNELNALQEAGRGCFDDTEQNLVDGEDLDVPTYLRRGIKLKA